MGDVVGIEVGEEDGRGVGLPPTYVGVSDGVEVGAALGVPEGNKVGAPIR